MVYTLTGKRPIVRLELDLVGDGLPAPLVVTGSDLRPFTSVTYQAPRSGRFSVHLTAVDSDGCTERTGRERLVDIP